MSTDDSAAQAPPPEAVPLPPEEGSDVPAAPADAAPEEAAVEDNPTLARALKDAARYRTKLRETETERAQLLATLDGYHRAEAERLAAEHLADPADMWRDGATAADLFGDDGRVDPLKVKALTGDLLKAHPHWSRNHKAAPRPDVKNLKSGTAVEIPRAQGWNAVLGGIDNR